MRNAIGVSERAPFTRGLIRSIALPLMISMVPHRIISFAALQTQSRKFSQPLAALQTEPLLYLYRLVGLIFVTRVLSLKVTSSRPAVPVDTVSLRMTDVLMLSARVSPPRVAFASPSMRLTVPIASCAATDHRRRSRQLSLQ